MSEWKESLSEDLSSHDSIGKFESIEDLAKSYINLETKLGDRNYIPKDADEKAWAEFYKRVVPEQYDLKFDDLKSINASEIVNDDVKAELKNMGLTNKQAQGMLDLFRRVVEGKENSIIEGNNAKKKQNEEEFNKEFPDETVRKQTKEQVDEFIRKRYGEDYLEALKASDAYQNVNYFKKLLSDARRSAPDKGVNENNSEGGGKTTKEELQAERSQLLTGTHPVYKRAALDYKDPAHGEATTRMKQLNSELATYEG